MRRNYFKHIIAGLLAAITISACTKKLDVVPTNDIGSTAVYSTPAGYRQSIAKVYGAMALTGNTGGTGRADISSQIINDEGNSDFLRMFWYLQCLSTDEAGWTYHSNTDPIGIHQMNWSSVNQTVAGLYFRSFFLITLSNEFIRQASDANLTSRSISGASADSIRKYKAEARFLRAYQYWVLMDLFANPPLVTENDLIGGAVPKQVGRDSLFRYIEGQLKGLETELAPARTNEYGRADQAAAWALLSRLYLNAPVYLGFSVDDARAKAYYTNAITYSKRVIDAGYTLHPKYKELMLADNHLNTDEFIFTINYDGTYTQNWGGTTTLAHGSAGVSGDSSGTSGSWGTTRITHNFVDLFDAADIRGQFWTTGQNKIMTNLLDVSTDGYSSTKFRNKTRTGAPAPHKDPAGNWVDIDFPVFRLAEIYLNYAEAVLRGGTGGDNATALGYLKQLAVRARPNDANANNYPQLTLPYIINERGRELFWECFRRTDLIRFGQFTTSGYLWAWKGGVPNGTAVDSKYNLYPIPSIDLSSNPNLVQNTGY
jgi:starch-binding outer membrane protein, SusD/RagB family